MKTYKVNVHYDFYAVVEVQAESEEEAINNARIIADETPMEELEFADYIDSCVVS